MKKTILYILLVMTCATASAQHIAVSLSKYPSLNYTFVRYWGVMTDTIKGRLDAQGKTNIILPDNGYTGMATLSLSNGANIQMVINKEHFDVETDEAQLNFMTLKFINSPENTFLVKAFNDYRLLNGKQNVIGAAMSLYTDQSPFRAELGKEQQRLKAEYAIFSNQNNSTLYAAHFLKLLAYTDKFNKYGELTQAEIDTLRSDGLKLNLEDTYSSSLWRKVIGCWAGLEYEKYPNHKYFVVDAIKLIQNTSSQTVRDEFANSLVDICEQYGWEDIKRTLGIVLLSNHLIDNPTRNLAILLQTLGVNVGATAPDFVIKDNHRLSDYSTNTVLLFFYEDGCDHCIAEMGELQKDYAELEKNGVKIISITSDKSIPTYENMASRFPWSDRINDLEGKISKEYGAFMAPTFFVIRAGKIVGRYATFKSTGLIRTIKETK